MLEFLAEKACYRVRHFPPADLDAETFNVEPVNLSAYLVPEGTTVILHGIESAPELNGRHGVVRSYDEPKDRYKVKVEGREKLAALKHYNCRLCEPVVE